MARDRLEWLLVRAPAAPEWRAALGDGPLRIGRDGGNQLVLADEYVSASHAEIVRRDRAAGRAAPAGGLAPPARRCGLVGALLRLVLVVAAALAILIGAAWLLA